jgi:hypothetical protein
MPYDLFISYSRRDNEQGRITELIDRIKADFARFAKREVVTFFDHQEIHGMSDWRQRILQGLRESRLLLADPEQFAQDGVELQLQIGDRRGLCATRIEDWRSGPTPGRSPLRPCRWTASRPRLRD